MQEMLQQLRRLSDLQRHLLPRSVPAPRSWSIATYYTAGTWPGGDYYDLQRLSDGRLLMLVGDASESGGPGTVQVALVRAVMHACPLSSGAEKLPFCPFRDPLVQGPHLILGQLNRVLVENSLEGQYLTAFCGVLSPDEGILHFANAGHPYPRLWRASSQTLETLDSSAGMPLGIDYRASYHHKRCMIDPADVLVVCSEGLICARDAGGHEFGWERLDRAICAAAGNGAEAIKAEVVEALATFLDGRQPDDDVTLLCAERLPQ
jgi:sigma-B regulation protein RsbU (phosphoserine phosphatase)